LTKERERERERERETDRSIAKMFLVSERNVRERRWGLCHLLDYRCRYRL